MSRNLDKAVDKALRISKREQKRMYVIVVKKT